jgi:hypothetical protein
MTVPAGIFGAQQQDLSDLTALSATFQAECASSSDPTVANHIKVVADEDWEAPLPCAIVCTSGDAQADDWGFASGSNIVIFQRLVEDDLAETDETANTREAFVRFDNWLGAVVSEIIEAARNGGHLLNLRAKREERPLRSARDETDPDGQHVDFIACRVRFTWGAK